MVDIGLPYSSVFYLHTAACTEINLGVKKCFSNWFEIKQQQRFTSGPTNFYHVIQRVLKFLNIKVKDFAFNVLRRNAFFARHENMLLPMLPDDDEIICNLTLKKVLHLRTEVIRSQIVISPSFTTA